MGSFNMACAVSQQTIAPRDTCRVLGLLQRVDYDTIKISPGSGSKAGSDAPDAARTVYGVPDMVCYYDGFWRPVGNFIHAKYDDYGTVGLVFEGAGNRDKVLYLLEEMLERGWVTQQGANQYHEGPFDLHAFMKKTSPELHQLLTTDARKAPVPETLDEAIVKCWDYAWDATRAGRVFLTDYMGVPRPFEFTIIQEPAYQALVEMTAAGSDWDDVPMELESYLRRAIKKAVAVLDDDGAKWELTNKLREAIRGADGVGYPMWDLAEAQLRTLGEGLATGTLTQEQVFETLLPLLRDRYALGGYTALNLRLTPAATASQDYHNQIGRDFAKFIEKVSPQVSRPRLERMYGAFKPYRMQVLTRDCIDELDAYLPEADAAMTGVSMVEAVPGILDVAFECTATEEELRDAIQKLRTSERTRMLTTLHPRKLGR